MQYAREESRIKAVQKRYEYSHYGRQSIRKPEPLSFEEWLKQGFEHFSKKGISFELVTP